MSAMEDEWNTCVGDAKGTGGAFVADYKDCILWADAELTALRKVKEAADILAPKVKAVFDAPELESIFMFCHAHGLEYKGPRCEREYLDALITALSALREGKEG